MFGWPCRLCQGQQIARPVLEMLKVWLEQALKTLCSRLVCDLVWLNCCLVCGGLCWQSCPAESQRLWLWHLQLHSAAKQAGLIDASQNTAYTQDMWPAGLESTRLEQSLLMITGCHWAQQMWAAFLEACRVFLCSLPAHKHMIYDCRNISSINNCNVRKCCIDNLSLSTSFLESEYDRIT